MAREAMKDLIRDRYKCTDERVGGWLSYYEKRNIDKAERDELNEKRRLLFREHLSECLHCMALYNIEIKHTHGYIDPNRTRARQIKIMLLEWLPSRKQILAALSMWIIAVSLATVRIDYFNPQEISDDFNSSAALYASLLALSPAPAPKPVASESDVQGASEQSGATGGRKSHPASSPKEITRVVDSTGQSKTASDLAQPIRNLDQAMTQPTQSVGTPDNSARMQLPATAGCHPEYARLAHKVKPVDSETQPANMAKETKEDAQEAESDSRTDTAKKRQENKEAQRQGAYFG